MPARTPVETVHEYYACVDEGDVDGLLSLFAPDVVYERPGHPRIEGKDALERFYRDVRPLADGSHELHGVVDGGDRVAARGSFSGEQRGESVEFGFADFFEFSADATITFRHTYTDRDVV